MNFGTAYDPFRALQGSWGLLKRAPATVLIGGVLLAFTDGGCSGGNQYVIDGGESFNGVEVAVIVAVAALVLAISIAFWLFACLLKVGFPRAIEKVLETGREDIGTIFQSNGRWAAMVVASLLQILATFAAAVPMVALFAIAAVVGAGMDLGGAGLVITIASGLLGLPIFIYVALGLSLVPQAVALEGLDATQALERSWTLVKGNRLQLLFFYVVTGVFSMLGFLACCVGVFFTSALSYAANAEAYLRLVRVRETQANWVE
jgi:hypothetical protein